MDTTIFRPGGLALTDRSAREAGIAPGSRVLDVGCGLGTTLEHLRSRYGAVCCGVDVSEKAVRTARERCPMIEFYWADASSLPFPDGQFDAVFMECSLSLMVCPEQALREAGRVLRPGGRLAVSTLSRARGAALIEAGAVSLEALEPCLIRLGFRDIVTIDHTDALVQMAADAIFRCGSLAAYQAAASETIGGAVLSCDTPPKGLGYHRILARKGSGA